mmetsp:Transcript_66108/g.107240  ORF Transcript_66108/g.107240 Transcript_66108/m.107240 type:complete len:104 (-) Transcript_66108:659-970(-)
MGRPRVRLFAPLVAHHLAPAIIDMNLDENWKCCDNKFEQILTLLHREHSKDIESSSQNSTHHLPIMSNPISMKSSKFMHRSMRWESSSIPMAAYDPHLLLLQP